MVDWERAAIRQAAAGDAAAFARLMEAHKDMVYTICLRTLSNAHDAEEAFQETFVSAFRALARFREEAQFSTWLFRIAVNRCRDMLSARASCGRHEAALAPLPRVKAPDAAVRLAMARIDSIAASSRAAAAADASRYLRLTQRAALAARQARAALAQAAAGFAEAAAEALLLIYEAAAWSGEAVDALTETWASSGAAITAVLLAIVIVLALVARDERLLTLRAEASFNRRIGP